MRICKQGKKKDNINRFWSKRESENVMLESNSVLMLIRSLKKSLVLNGLKGMITPG